MKKKICLALLSILALALWTGAASAATVDPAPAAKIGCILPRGMRDAAQATATVVDGSITLSIKDDKVDWADVFASGGDNNIGEIVWQIKAPDGIAAGCYVIVGEGDSEAEALELVEEQENKGQYQYIGSLIDGGVPCNGVGMPITRKGEIIATAITELNYVLPRDRSFVFIARWYDADRNQVGNDWKLSVSLSHSQKEPFVAEISRPAAQTRIATNMDNVSDVSVLEKKDGYVNYLLGNGKTVKTGVKAVNPNATHFSTAGNMLSETVEPVPLETIDGEKYATVETTAHLDAGGGMQSFFFCDAQGKILETVTVNIRYQSDEVMKVWPAYQQDFTPLPANQLTVVNEAQGVGYQTSYNEDNGNLACRFATSSQTGAGALMKNNVTLKITANTEWAEEDGLWGYRIYEVGSNSLLGPTAGSLDGLLLKLDQIYPDGPSEYVDPLIYTGNYAPFKIVEPSDDSIVIYAPDESDAIDNFVRLYIVEWINEEYRYYNYFWLTTEPFAVTEQSVTVASLAELTKPVEHPVLVTALENLELVVRRYTTQSDAAWHYELYLRARDEDGNWRKIVSLTEAVKIVLPYPEGRQEGDHYRLNHYDEDLYKGTALGAKNQPSLTESEYGLVFETNSFSPFILSLTDGETPDVPSGDVPSGDAPPKTGDDAPLALWLALIAISAAAATLLLRRGKKKA